MEDEHTKEPLHNNPEEAADYVKAVNLLLQSFVNDIHGFNRYNVKMHTRPFCTLYPSFSPNWTVHISPTWTQKLCSTQYPTRYVPPFLHVLKKQQTKYSNVFPVTAYQQAPKLHPKCAYKETYHLLIKKKGQQAITKLFGHLQDAHNHMSEVAKAVVDVSEVSSPEQFTFVLQLAVRPIIQFKIPPHLSAPTELKFEKERLTPEEITEENCCNLILP